LYWIGKNLAASESGAFALAPHTVTRLCEQEDEPQMSGLGQDLRYALRQIRKNPGFTAVAALTLALGIGANTAIFSVVNAVLLNPLPFPNASRIVSLFEATPNFPQGSISYPNFLDWQRENHSFEAMAAFRWTDGAITGVGEAEAVQARRVSANFFPILGVNPILGRNFTPEEDRRGANPTALISEGLWKRKFGRDPNVVGKRLIVAGQGRTIIGVIPASFRLSIWNFQTADVYEPIGEETDQAFFLRDTYWGMDAIGVLKPGVTLAQARDDMKRVNSALAVAYPKEDGNIKANIIALKDEIVGDMRPALLVLLGAVGFVLLIACVNVANLLLARSTSRQREFSVRAALGAGQARILRQLLTESVLLSLLGGGFGLILAKWGTTAALAAVPQTVPRAEEIGMNLHVLLFTAFISVLTGILFGLLPALRMSRSDISGRLKESGRTISGSHSRTQSVLVMGEMAMALVLLVGAGLMCRTLVQLWKVDPGFDPHNLSYFSVAPASSLVHQSPDAVRAALRQVEATIRSVPGVEALSLHYGARPMDSDNERGFLLEGQDLPTRQNKTFQQALEYGVEPEYLETMRIPLLRGRFLSDQDNEHSVRVVVIDTSFAQEYFRGQDPIGKQIRIFELENDSTKQVQIPLVIVGVVGHVNQWGLADDASQPLQAQIYRPILQSGDAEMKELAQGFGVFVRSRSPLGPEAFFQSIRRKLLAGNQDMIVSDNQTEEEVVASSIASQRFSLILLGVFAGLALLLAGIGIYGVLSYLVGQRTQEIGVRMALGAQRLDVLRMVLRDGARMALLGAAIGLVAALVLTRLMASMLFGVRPTDPITFVAMVVLLSGIALFACYLPARRAAKVDPMVALRYE
jgi:predicted permease